MAVDVRAIKEAAKGRWPELLSRLAGIPIEVLDGKGHPCPKCGGIDRFSLAWPEEGGCLCRQCFNRSNSDGIAAIQHYADVDFKTALRMLADDLGIKGRNGAAKRGKPPKPKVFATPQGVVRYFMESIARSKGAGVEFVASWKYETFYVLRFDLQTPAGEKQRKEFRPVHQVPLGTEGATGWTYGYPKPDKDRPLYQLPKITAAADSSLVTIHGGEKAVDAAAKLGLLATTNAGGEQAIRNTDWSPILRFSTLALAIDNDPTGKAFGQMVAAMVLKMKPDADVRLICLPDLPPKGDIVEWIEAGGTREQFLNLVAETPAATDEQAAEWAKAERKKRSHAEREIVIGTDESRVVDEAIDVLTTCENVYQRGGRLVQVVDGTKPVI